MLVIATWLGLCRHVVRTTKRLVVRTKLGGNVVGTVNLIRDASIFKVVRDIQCQVARLLPNHGLTELNTKLENKSNNKLGESNEDITSKSVWMQLGGVVVSPGVVSKCFSKKRVMDVDKAFRNNDGFLDVKWIEDPPCATTLPGLSISSEVDGELVIYSCSNAPVPKGICDYYNNGWYGNIITKVTLCTSNFCDPGNLAWPGLDTLKLVFNLVPSRNFPRLAHTFSKLTKLVLDASLEGTQSFAGFTQLETLRVVNFEGCSSILDLPTSLKHLVMEHAVRKEQLPDLSNLTNLETLKARYCIQGQVPPYVLTLPRLYLLDLQHNDVSANLVGNLRIKVLINKTNNTK